MRIKLKQIFKLKNIDVLILLADSVFYLLYILRDISKPLWFDEVWRSYLIANNFQISNLDKAGLAPITLGHYLFVKIVSFFGENEFAQRSLTYLSVFIILIFIILIGRKLKNSYFSALLLLTIPFTQFFFEYAVSNKPYLTDIAVTLILLYFVLKFYKKTINYKVLTVVFLVSLIFSFSSFFIIPLAVMLFTYRFYKQKDFKGLKQILIFGAITAFVLVVYYLCFIKPQVTLELETWWKDFTLGDTPVNFLKTIVASIAGVFGFDRVSGFQIQGWIPYGSVISYESQLEFLKVFEQPFVIGITISAIAGFVLLVRQKKFVLPWFISGIMLLQLVTALIGKWPFGNNRANGFVFVLISLTAMYFVYTMILHFYKFKNYPLLILLIIIGLNFFPFLRITNSVTKDQGVAYLEGMKNIAVYVAQNSTQGDKVLVYSPFSKLAFLYYYENYSASKSFEARSNDYEFDPSYKPLDYSPEIFNNIQNKKIWIVWVSVSGPQNPAFNSLQSFEKVYSTNSDTVYLDKLQKIKVE